MRSFTSFFRSAVAFLLALLFISPLFAQGTSSEAGKPADSAAPAKKKASLYRDTLDHKLDFSRYLIQAHGFVPWPVIISEPALGGFGGALALVFISPKKSAGKEEGYRFPDITGVAGMYTLNNSWGAGAMRQGTFPKIGMRYTVGAAYGSINMDFYRNTVYLPNPRTIKTEFNLKITGASLDVSENIWKNKIFGGLTYLFAYVDVSYDFPELPDTLRDLFNPEDFKKNIGALGFYPEWDNRNSIFTPDKGVRFKANCSFGRTWTGSSFDFEMIDAFTTVFINPVKWLVCGFKAEGQGISSDVPFYTLPYIDMRGIPMMRYQGNGTLQFETEERFDITRRWSLVGFAGTGRTWAASKHLQDDAWHWAGGGGFRYLLARLFRLRMGVDVAGSKNQFAYYIVLGQYWDR
jgi:hypothetical protein